MPSTSSIPAQYILLGFGRASVFATFIPVYVFLLLPVIAAIQQDNERFLERVAKVQWGMMISVYCIESCTGDRHAADSRL